MKQAENNHQPPSSKKRDRWLFLILVIVITSGVVVLGISAFIPGSDEDPSNNTRTQRSFSIPGDSIMQIYVVNEDTMIVSLKGELTLTSFDQIDKVIKNYNGEMVSMKFSSKDGTLWAGVIAQNNTRRGQRQLLFLCSEKEMNLVVALFKQRD
jgi:hypothetical protein